MIQYVNENEIKSIIDKNSGLIMIFAKGNNCGVCNAVSDRVNNVLSNKYKNLNIYYVDLESSPNFRGTHLIFTIPTILLYENNKEIHRESRIIDFNKLERMLSLYFD